MREFLDKSVLRNPFVWFAIGIAVAIQNSEARKHG